MEFPLNVFWTLADQKKLQLQNIKLQIREGYGMEAVKFQVERNFIFCSVVIKFSALYMQGKSSITEPHLQP